MIAAMKDTPASAAGKWASIIATLCHRNAGGNVFAAGGDNFGGANDLPNWAVGSVDKRAALHWDTSQTIANCKVNGVATLAIVDSGSYKTIMDTAMAKILGLRVRQACRGDCGTYSVPGTGQTNAYEGVVDEEVRI
jgi:hypothetical protein